MRGIAFMLVSTLSMSAMIAVVRYLSADLHPFQLAFFRAFFGFLFFLPFLMRQGLTPFRTRRIGVHSLRAVLHSISVLSLIHI